MWASEAGGDVNRIVINDYGHAPFCLDDLRSSWHLRPYGSASLKLAIIQNKYEILLYIRYYVFRWLCLKETVQQAAKVAKNRQNELTHYKITCSSMSLLILMYILVSGRRKMAFLIKILKWLFWVILWCEAFFLNISEQQVPTPRNIKLIWHSFKMYAIKHKTDLS